MVNFDMIIGRTSGSSITASAERRLSEITNPDEFREVAELFRRKAAEETNPAWRDEWLTAAERAMERVPDSS